MSRKQHSRTILPSMLIGIGWVLLAWNVIILIEGSTHPRHTNFVEQATTTISTHFLHSAMIAAGAIALALVAYLHFKQDYAKATIVATAIVTVLTASLLFPTTPQASATMNIADSNAAPAKIGAGRIYLDGLVTGIVFSNNRPAAVVGSQVLYEGDVKQGVTIIRITKDKVQFEKNGMLWTQAVQEVPSSLWK